MIKFPACLDGSEWGWFANLSSVCVWMEAERLEKYLQIPPRHEEIFTSSTPNSQADTQPFANHLAHPQPESSQ